MIPQHEIEEVLSRADIYEVASEFLPLKKSGAGFTCCCPFHKEKSPSFYVSPTRNIYKCFGCGKGGDIVSFLKEKEGMSFMEAIKYLANKYHVTLHEQTVEETDEQRRARLHKESIQHQYEAVQSFYEDNIRKADKEAVAAYKYAKERWDAEFVKDQGIGYAYTSKGETLYDYAKSHSLSIEILKELGLLAQSEDGRIYDFYRGRLMIPIRDRYKHVIGYTARAIPGETDKPTSKGHTPPKYINSPNSEVYTKDNTLFGIDQAWIAAASQGRCYCVEGAPDALRLHKIGYKNTVACLGADWTDNQLSQLRKRCDTLCFIPDSDPPKAGETIGVGLAKVIKAGAKAIALHFKVFVKEIGTDDKNQKRDADSFFKTDSAFQAVKEEDFVLWYARRLFPEGRPDDEANKDKALENLSLIAEILSYIDEGFELNHYVDQLNKIHPGKITWQNAITHARVKRAEAQMQQNLSKELDLLKELGFGIEYHSYYSLNQQGGHFIWSNFTMKPLYHIKDTQSAIRLYEMTNKDGHQETVELRQEDLISLARFRQKVESLGNYIWLAKEEQLQKLKQYLYKATKSAELITQLGWQRGGFFAFGNGIYYNGQWLPVNEFGIVAIQHPTPEGASEPAESNYYLPAFSKLYKDTKFYEFERSFVHKAYGNISLLNYSKMLVEVFGDNAKIGLCFLLASMFRDIIVDYTKWFPLLNLFGPPHSGKSELGHSLMSFFIIENNPPNIENSTVAALSDAVAQTANALVHLDEFKDSIDITKREFLKGLWDGTGRNRMNMDKDKKREITKVDTGVIISGQEMAVSDIALFTRFVFLSFELHTPTPEQTARFERMTEVRKLGCSHLTLQILAHRAYFEQNFHAAYISTLEDIQTALAQEPVEIRILKNWVVPLAAFQTLRNQLELPFTYEQLKTIAVNGIKKQSEKCKSNQDVGVWWNIVSFLASQGKIYDRCHFRIDTEHKISMDEGELESQEPITILKIRVKPIFELYLEHAKKTGQKVLGKASLDYYLEHSPELLGHKHSVRFDDIKDGILQYEEDAEGHATNRKKTFTDQVLLFNYTDVNKHYGVTLL